MPPAPAPAPRPHDHFFKLLFQAPEQAASYLRGALPPDVLLQLNLDGLQADPASYIDEQLRESFADAVFRCPFRAGGEVYVAFLLEHKSYPVKYPHLQLLRYMLNIWERQLAANEGLSPVIPCMMYHGMQRWEYSPMEAYFGPQAGVFAPFIPSFRYLLTNLRTEPEASIRQQFTDWFLQQGLLLMKYILDQHANVQIAQLLEEMDAKSREGEQGLRYIRMLAAYIAHGASHTHPELMKKAKTLMETWGYEEGSMAHLWLLEGEKRGQKIGKEIGREQTLRQSLARMLGRGLPLSEAADLLGIPLELAERLTAVPPER